jgi:hypothetical protein
MSKGRKLSLSSSTTPGGNIHAIPNCLAALRRVLERISQEDDINARLIFDVAISNSTIQSYRHGLLTIYPRN